MPTNVGNLYGYKNASIQPTDPMYLVYTNSNDLSVNLPIYANDGSLSSCISSVSGDTFEIYPFYYTTISNCITVIPQDIQLVLNSGVLTLKQGSKVYKPNGTGVFSEFIINADKSYSGTDSSTYQALVFYSGGTTIDICSLGESASGTSPGSFTGVYYNTSTNKINLYALGNPLGSDYYLPVGLVTMSGSSGITSIDKIFNGFGYIGSTIFALPGVKGLIPNGKTSTNLLKGVQATTTSVSINSGGGTNQSNITFGLTLTGDLVLNENAIYDTTNNYVYDGATEVNQCFCGTFDKVGGKVSNFYVKPINT